MTMPVQVEQAIAARR